MGKTIHLNIQLVTVRQQELPRMLLFTKENKKAKQKEKKFIYTCVFFKAMICSMFLQICLYDIVKIKVGLLTRGKMSWSGVILPLQGNWGGGRGSAS